MRNKKVETRLVTIFQSGNLEQVKEFFDEYKGHYFDFFIDRKKTCFRLTQIEHVPYIYYHQKCAALHAFKQGNFKLLEDLEFYRFERTQMYQFTKYVSGKLERFTNWISMIDKSSYKNKFFLHNSERSLIEMICTGAYDNFKMDLIYHLIDNYDFAEEHFQKQVDKMDTNRKQEVAKLLNRRRNLKILLDDSLDRNL